ncbi:MAG: hypothetical protein CMQ34_12340 [Gammaproteobacteria bacterium]|nr:hypothetical protein [Gammaproteobacteria bacterium]
MTSATSADNTFVTIALCPDEDVTGGDAGQRYYAADGSRQFLTVSADADLPASCTTALLQTGGTVLWSAPAAPMPAEDSIEQVGLLGDFTGETMSVSDVLVIPAAAPAVETEFDVDVDIRMPRVADQPPLPLNESVLPQFVSRTFGVDERVTASGPGQLRCSPGDNIAGALLASERSWAVGTGLQLEVRARGEGRFQVAIGDMQRDRLQAPLPVGELLLPASGADNYRFSLPDNRLPWTSVTIICPEEQGELELLSLTISTAPGRQQREQLDMPALLPPRRGAWLWSPQLWQESPEIVWQAQWQQQLTEVYISIPVNEAGQVADRDSLTRFLAEAHDRDLQVRVVIGDPRDVLPASLPALEARILAFLRYNREAAQSAQLSGVQLDIEPYLLRGFGRAQPYWRERYLSVIRHIHSMLDGQLSLDLVVPAWWGAHPAWGEQLLSQLPVDNLRLSIMNYHTAAERLRANAAPFLAWGKRVSVPVVIGLESGFLPDETHRRYRHHPQQGELWLVPVGAESVFVLFDTPQSGLPGRAFTFAFDYLVPAEDYTFAGDVARLNTVAEALSREWQSSPAFAGIAIHGLDDTRVKTGNQ